MDHATTTAPTRRRSRFGRSIAALAATGALVGAGLFTASNASAATEQMNFILTGSITIGATTIPLPAGSGWTATVDTDTGAITNGTVSIPGIPSVQQGQNVVTTISDAVPATGTLDLVTGEITLDSTFKVTVALPDLQLTCEVSPINVGPSTANAGGSDLTGDPATATLTDSEFSVPVATASAACPINALVDTTLGLPTSATNIVLTITQTDTPVTTTTTAAPAVTTTTAKAAAAAATNTNANFTG